MDQFPSSKFERGKIFTKAGLKVGTNYAKHHLDRVIRKKETDSSDLHRNNANELYKAFTQLRGTALKIAQSISVDNSGILPDEFIHVMSQAQYKVPPINPVLVRTIIKRELGDYPENLFESFDLHAIAAASIGQVHVAHHKDFGKVAVKIQYPNVRETIQSDLKMAKTIFKQVVKSAQTDSYFEEIRDRLIEETDYILEGNSMETFHATYASDFFETPRFISSLSTSKVLTMTFLEGKHLQEYLQAEPNQEERNHYGQLLWDFFHNQINESRTIHADAHPGNYMFMENGKLGILDFGCMKHFPKEFFDGYMSALPFHDNNDDAHLHKLYKKLELIRSDDEHAGVDESFYTFFKSFGNTFIRPYKVDSFSFDNPEYRQEISDQLKKATSFKEPVGSRHFLYSTRTHMGLYNMLFELKAEIKTKQSIQKLTSYLDTFADIES
ncbi:AarF/ABC1/UbiB kinase family protein [bacterium]|nr:MAG: AarF/ABC1/UbiB kinase family protein [bacterium]